MRVLFVTRKYPPRLGGMESLSYGLTQGYPEPKTIVSLGRSQKHLVWFFPYVVLRLALTAHRYDVVHLGDALLSSAGLIPRVLFRRRVVVSVHGLDMTWPVAAYQLYLKLFLRADAFIANSESTRRLAQARGLSRVRAISIGVAERYFSVVRNPRSDAEVAARREGRVVLITVGRLVRRKGAAWFVRHVLPTLRNVLYVVVGVGPEREAIERAAQDVGRAADVVLVGEVSDARLLDLLAAADIFVMPNISVPGDVEGFGIVAIEASASGLPVVASRLEGIPDAIADGQNGRLLTSGDADAYGATLREWVENEDLRRSLGEQGRAYTRASNSWPRIVEKYAELFEGVERGD